MLRFVRRGRAAQRKRDLDEDAPSDFEEIASDLDTEELGQWLSTQNYKTDLLPGQQLVRKYMAPGTVHDLWEHYLSTQNLLGCHAVGHLGLFTNNFFTLFGGCPTKLCFSGFFNRNTAHLSKVQHIQFGVQNPVV